VNQYRVGIIGCGEVVQVMHLPSLDKLSDQFRVTALCDISSAVLNGVGDRWRVAGRFKDYRDLIEQADVDVLLIANPHAYHAPATLAAIAAGKHVLVEKPMCLNLREADAIDAALHQTDVVVQVAYMRRYAPAFVEACRLVGDLAGIRLAHVHDVIGDDDAVVRNTAHVIRPTDVADSDIQAGREAQRAGIRKGIGDAPPDLEMAYLLLLALSSHDLSAMREMLGRPKRVLHASQRQGGLYLTAVFDYGEYVCQFETGVDSIPRTDTWVDVYASNTVVRVQYETPYVLNMPIRLLVTRANERGGVVQQSIHPTWGNMFVSEWEAFHDNITTGQQPKTSVADFRDDLVLFNAMIDIMRKDM
jgi:predicted dehydrogenase